MTAVPVELPDEPGWSTLSVGRIHVLVRAGGALVERVRAAAGDGDLDEVLDALSADGVRATPDFVAVLEGSPLRVVTRGSAYAVGSAPDGPSELRATGRGPWADQDAEPEVTALVLCTGSQAVAAPSAQTPPAVPEAPEAPEATTPPPAEPTASGGGAGWRLPSVFGRTRDQGVPEAQPSQPAPTVQPTQPAQPAQPAATVAEVGDEVGDGGDGGEVEELPSYDHLFGATQHDRPAYIEKHDTQGILEPPIGHAPIESAGGFDPRDAVEQQPAQRHPDHTLAPPADTGRPTPAPPQGGLISSVPWRSGGSAVPAAVPAPAPPTEPAPAPRSEPAAAAPLTEPAALAPPAAPAAPAPSPAPLLPAPPVTPAVDASRGSSDDPDTGGDSDATVDRSALLAGRAAVSGPTVLAVLCPAGHSSPPHSGVCRLCGREVPPQQPFQTARPPLGLLRLASGDVVQLDRGVLLGRSPKVNAELGAADRPHLVRVASAQNDISRNHVEIVLEGWHVLIRDLGSTNGTTVALPGQHPVRLRPSDQQVIEPGTVITLADEVSLTYEVGS